MRIYFSGGRGLKYVPEALTPERKPHVMLTFHDISSNGTLDRLNAYFERQGLPLLGRKGKATESPSAKVDHPLYSASVFMDSGAFTFYGMHVIKKSIGANGKELESKRAWGQGDYTFYSLKPGSEFRCYCDRYAKFMQRLKDSGVLFVTVDAIFNPFITWQVQQYFEKEHGVRPVPVIHGGTPHGPRWLARYLEAGHTLVGFGGLGHLMRVSTYRPWANDMFRLLCPASNGHRPVARVHGFAMTSWGFMREWPWWSVDSATWIKLAAYGWVLVPAWRKGQFVHDEPPMQLNFSRKPTRSIRQAGKRPGETKDCHYDNCSKYYREVADRWLKHLGIPLGAYRGEAVGNVEGFQLGEQMDPDNWEMGTSGATSDFIVRARANLQYFADFQASLPKWPFPLDEEVVKERQKIQYRHGLGL